MKDLHHLSHGELIARAEALIEAIPYFSQFRGSTVVIKYGGAAMVDERLEEATLQDIALMHLVGIRPIVVHGGGKEITELLARLGAPTRFVDGQRVTDEQALDAAEMVLAGRIAGEIVSRLNRNGCRAVGLSGKDGALLTASKMSGKHDLGFVGDIDTVEPRVLHVLLDAGFLPVVSPIGVGTDGQGYNINADIAAREIAVAMRARKLVFLSDTPGVLRDAADPASVIPTIVGSEVEELISTGVIKGGMIPKVRSAAGALEACEQVHILDGRVPHALLLELFTESGVGTQIIRAIG